MAKEQAHRPIVLMVEDDLDFAADMRAMLDGIVRIDRVSTTTVAAASLLRGLPDLLWLDLDLPTFFAQTGGLEGVAFLRLVRERLAPEMPVVVVSGQLTTELRRELRQLKVIACFGKPPEVGKLVAVLQAEPLSARTEQTGKGDGRSIGPVRNHLETGEVPPSKDRGREAFQQLQGEQEDESGKRSRTSG